MKNEKTSSLLPDTSQNFDRNSWYNIMSPFQITYEYCSGNAPDDFCNILTISATGSSYRRIPLCQQVKFNARPTHMHNFFELFIILKGNIIQRIDGKEFMYPAGSCCLINRNLAHAEKFTEETKLLFIGISTDLATELLNAYKTACFPEEIRHNNNFILQFFKESMDSSQKRSYLDFFPKHNTPHLIHSDLEQFSESLIHTAFFPKPGATYMIKGLIYSLLHQLTDEAIYHYTRVQLELDADLLLFARITHLFEDTDGRISRSELENVLHYNGSYMNSIVKRRTGMCLFDYGMTFCLKKAAVLLSTTDKSISAIASMLHFSNRTHFYKLFKEKYGLTPKEYRKTFTQNVL